MHLIEDAFLWVSDVKNILSGLGLQFVKYWRLVREKRILTFHLIVKFNH